MKESYLRSKISLQPLNNSDFKSKKTLVDYQEYEDQLSSYEKNKKYPDITDLFDWTKPSEIMQIKQPQSLSRAPREPEVLQNNSMNTDELLGSDGEEMESPSERDIDLDDSIEVQSPVLSPRQTYAEQVRGDFGSEYKLMSQIKLQNDLKDMRERIMQMNVKLNKMLDKYQLLAGTTKRKDVQIANPYIFLSKQIEINHKIIEKQLRHIRQIEEKDKELEKKDYLVELTDLIIEIKKEIHDLEKEKHGQSVDVDRINKMLKEIEQVQEDGDQYKQIKNLKHHIVFYFKKLKEQKIIQEQLDKDKEALMEKEEAMAQRLTEKTRVATEKCLEVSANRPYVQLKMKYDQLVVLTESQKKKREAIIRNVKMTEEKLEKENEQMRKEIQKCQFDIQEIEYRSQGFDDDAKNIMTKNNIVNRELRAISYRFDESLIHPERGKFKPDFKRVLSKMEGKVNRTIDCASQIDKKYIPINDKNGVANEKVESIENDESSSVSGLSRMKPILRSWKGKAQNERYSGSPEKYRTIQNSSIFKPPPLMRSKK